MRAFFMVTAAVLLVGLTGCRSPENRSGMDSARVSGGPGSVDPETGAMPKIELVDGVAGTVEAVNREAQYVVIEFFPNPLPESGERFSIYRNGQKVGEVRLSEPRRGTLTAGDIIAGEAHVGDEVRKR